MASAVDLARTTGYSRDAIDVRIKRFGLKSPYDGRDIFDLKPLHEIRSPDGMTLEQARTALAVTQERKASIEVETLEKKRIPIEVLNEAMAQCFAEIRATIDGSALTQREKDNICDAIRDTPSRLRW